MLSAGDQLTEHTYMSGQVPKFSTYLRYLQQISHTTEKGLCLCIWHPLSIFFANDSTVSENVDPRNLSAIQVHVASTTLHNSRGLLLCTLRDTRVVLEAQLLPLARFSSVVQSSRALTRLAVMKALILLPSG